MEQIEQRKEKAAELSSGRHANPDYAPKLTPYERKKQCSLCTVVVCTAHLITSLSVLSDVHWCKGIYYTVPWNFKIWLLTWYFLLLVIVPIPSHKSRIKNQLSSSCNHWILVHFGCEAYFSCSFDNYDQFVLYSDIYSEVVGFKQ